MATFYLGLSMAGTVSAGTYTAGCLGELNTWLSNWQVALETQKPIVLTAEVDTENYRKGDAVTIEPFEIPSHEVKIKALTGASGGGVSAALYLIGLIKGDIDKYLRDVWMSFDINDMLDTNDLDNDGKIYSALNTLPIDKIQIELNKIQLDMNDSDRIKKVRYLEDVVELYQTLTSYEVIPYSLVHYQANLTGSFKNHFDYIRFGFVKDGSKTDNDHIAPYRHNLEVVGGLLLNTDESWKKLIESTPATGAFPIGFRSRSIIRQRKEYLGKLFYLKYAAASNANTTGSEGIDYDAIIPDWLGSPDSDELFEMVYFDGGTFNREPHDLARAALIRFLNKKGLLETNKLPSDGQNVFASVILIDPFPSVRTKVLPGDQAKEIPTLIGQPPLIIGSLLDQGRFHTDWIEKTMDENYYSRFLISPVRKKEDNTLDSNSLAGEKFAAFAGFLNKNYRNHDYSLGHYNTFRFLSRYFIVPSNNKTVTYATGISDETREKYIALGWLIKEDNNEYCQIIPRFVEGSNQNKNLPDWPHISMEEWNEIKEKALTRAKAMVEKYLTFWEIIEEGIWLFLVKKKVENALDNMEKELLLAKLIR